MPNNKVTDVIIELSVTYAVDVHGSETTIENVVERHPVVSSDIVAVAVI